MSGHKRTPRPVGLPPAGTVYAHDGSAVRDGHGNRATVKRWGSLEAALLSLATNTQCWGCIDCSYCDQCKDCQDCHNCKKSTKCKDCHELHMCHRCTECLVCHNQVRLKNASFRPAYYNTTYAWGLQKLAFLDAERASKGLQPRSKKPFNPCDVLPHGHEKAPENLAK